MQKFKTVLHCDAAPAPTPLLLLILVKIKNFIHFCGLPAPARKMMRLRRRNTNLLTHALSTFPSKQINQATITAIPSACHVFGVLEQPVLNIALPSPNTKAVTVYTVLSF
jgi:hypothetical protein